MVEYNFEREIGQIYRLEIPFEDLYTSVFLIQTEGGNVLIDCATTDKDVNEYIVPALEKMRLTLQDIHYLIITHNHIDHSGGKERILQLNDNVNIIVGLCTFSLNGITVYDLKGHTNDFIGVFDSRTNTLISGDGLQGYGVGKYRCSLESKAEYMKTIQRIKRDKRIENVLFSHAYEPWFVDGVFGRESVEKCLNDCKNFID